MSRSKLVKVSFIVVSLGCILMACGTAVSTMQVSTPNQPQEGPTQVAILTPEKTTLTLGVWGTTNPNNFCTLRPMMGNEEIWRNRFVGATLLTLNENNEWVPNLAMTYEISSDAMSYTFHLNTDAKWHDGNPFTSNDVIYTFELLLNPEIGSYGELLREIVNRVEAVDDYTVTFNMQRPIIPGDFSSDSDFWNLVTGWIPVPKHILENYQPLEICYTDWANGNYIGLGPFQVAEFVPDDHVVYIPFKDYHLGASEMEQVTIRFSTDPAKIFDAFKAGEYDMAQLTPEYASQITQDKTLYLPPETSLIAVNLNLTTWPPTDQYVRRALVEHKYETFVPYIDDPSSIIGNAALYPLYSEMSSAVYKLQNVINVEFNLPRTVRIVDEGWVVLWTPIAPESAPMDISDVDNFWSVVNNMGGLNVGIIVFDNVPASVWAQVTENGGREIILEGADGSILKTYGESDYLRYGMSSTSVEIPSAGIDLGTTWCRGHIGPIWFMYPCGW
jgi:Bacterial extracellular solute-binding proteins, family 5 Middle